jgi:hypothetical protein
MATMMSKADPNDPTELDAVLAAVQSMRARITTHVAPAQVAASSGELAERLILDLKSRVGDKIRSMLIAEAKLSEKGDYTMADLAKAISQSLVQIRSHRGNLGRSLVRARRSAPGAPELWVWHDDRCRMPEDVRKAVLKHLLADLRSAIGSR